MRSACWMVGLALVLQASPGLAQNNAAAEELFQRGVAALKSGDFAKACPALADSQRLDPRPGTLFSLADCEAQWGKLATASSHFSDYLSQTSSLPAAQASKHESRRAIAQQKLADLKALIPRATLVVDSAATTIEVTLDGAKLSGASLGVPLPLDPGEHSVVVQAGGLSRSSTFALKPGQSSTIRLLLPASSSMSGDEVQDPWRQNSSDSRGASSPSGAGERKASGAGRIPLYTAAGVGVAGIIVGSVGGLIALNKRDTIEQDCVGKRCTPAGKEAGDSANRAALLSTIGFGVGAVGLAAAGVLYFLEPKRSDTTAGGWRIGPAVSAGGRYGMLLDGRFLVSHPYFRQAGNADDLSLVCRALACLADRLRGPPRAGERV